MGMQTRTRQMAPLTLRAQFAPSTVDADKRTVQMTWTTGAPVLRGGLFTDPYYEQLSLAPGAVRMDRLRSGTAPLLNTHNSFDINDILGVVQDARLDPGGLTGSATVRFDSGEAGANAMRMVSEGTLRNVSVGYRTYEMQRIDDAADGTPVFLATDWEPYELSMVPIGADADAATRSVGTTTNLCVFTEERSMETDTAPTTTPPAVAPAPIAAPVAQLAPAATTPTAEQMRAATEAAANAAVARVLGIQRIGRKLNRPDAEVQSAIDGGMTLDAFRASAVDAFAAAPSDQGGHIGFERRDPRIEAGQDVRDKWQRGASAWLIQKAGLGRLFAEAREAAKTTRYANESWAQEFVQLDLDPGEFRGMKLVDLARQSLDNSGVNTRGLMPMEFVGTALARGATMTRGGPSASTADFPVLLENTLYKILLAQYMTTPDTWTRFCAVGSVQDFRPSNRYRAGSFGTLSPLNENGEFTYKVIPDGEKQQISAKTVGNLISIGRAAIINDDMGVFSSLATGMGRASKLTIEVKVYAQLALNGGLGPLMNDGLTLFHANHNNIGTGAPLGSNAIDADRVLMGSQKDVSKNEILQLSPSVLLVPLGLGGTAKQINNSQYDFDALNKFQIANKVGGLFKDIVDTARLSGTRRYMFADPAVAPTFEVVYLDGQQQPFMDIKQGWDVDGVQWKVRLDTDVGPVDYRGAVTNAGA